MPDPKETRLIGGGARHDIALVRLDVVPAAVSVTGPYPAIRGVCRRAGHFGPDPLAQSRLLAAAVANLSVNYRTIRVLSLRARRTRAAPSTSR
jgi:hypothetical protein